MRDFLKGEHQFYLESTVCAICGGCLALVVFL